MERTDQAEESRRLRELYAQMSEGELRASADEVDDLSETAQQTLRAELSRRGLEVQALDARADELDQDDDAIPDDPNLADVWSAKDLPEARRLKSLLDSAGIACCLVQEKTNNAGLGKTPPDKAAKIRVLMPNLERALEIIYQYFAPEGEGNKEYVAHCPHCHSSEVVFQSLDGSPPEGLVTRAKFNWTCDACGYAWKDEGAEEES